MRSYLLAVIPIILSLGLLAALRLNTPAQTPVLLLDHVDTQGRPLSQDENPIRRGEDLNTEGNEWRAYTIKSEQSRTSIVLDENTTLTLEDTSTNRPRLAMRQGRVVTYGPIDISIRTTTIHADGLVTFVFYSWLEKLDVMSLGGTVTLFRNGQEVMNVPQNFSIDTLQVETSPTPVEPFEIVTSSAKAFYSWGLKK